MSDEFCMSDFDFLKCPLVSSPQTEAAACFGEALNGQSFSFDGNDLFRWTTETERKCLGGPGRFKIETPSLAFAFAPPPSLVPCFSLFLSVRPSVCLSLSLPSSILPSHHFDWIPGCDSGLSSHVIHLCLAPKGYLTEELGIYASIHLEKKQCFMQPCVCVCVCVRVCVCVKQNTNSEWQLTSCNSLWL